MEKNVAGKWVVFAFGNPDHASPGEPVTGDAANITANIRIDGGAANAVDDTNPTELEDGYYVFDITATESNGDLLSLHPASSTTDVIVIGVPGAVWTRPANFNALGIAADGDLSGNVDGAVASVTGAVGSVTGSVGSVTGAVGSVTGNVGGSVASVTAGVTLAAGAITNASLAGNMEIVFETDFATNYNTTRNAWVTNYTDTLGTDPVTAYDGPTNAEMEARTLVAANYATAANLATVDTVVDGIQTDLDNGTDGLGAIKTAVDGIPTSNPTAAAIVDEWESQSQLDPTGFHVNVLEVNGTAQTAGDIAALIATADAVIDSVLSMLDDARTEPAQGAPPVNPDAMTKIDYLYKAWRNRSTQTATQYSLYADDATTIDHKATVSDDGTTADKGEIATGP